MHFPSFWARGTFGTTSVWRWSDRSRDEAQREASEAARALHDRLAAGTLGPRGDYGYARGPLREPVLRAVKNSQGAVLGVVTRNAAGCDVLSTRESMFLDVDFPPRAPPRRGFLARLLGRQASSAGDQHEEDEAIERIDGFVRSRPGFVLRVYRTHSGLRLLATHATFDPRRAADEFFAALGVDPLYGRMCQAQQSFRARLTPKPWRAGVPPPPERWPFVDTVAEARFERWHERYRAATEALSTCRYVCTVGRGPEHPEVEPVRRLHDEATGAASGRALA